MKKSRLIGYLTGAILLLISGCYFRNNLLETRQKSTVATVIKLNVYQIHGANYDLYEYTINGKRYTYKGAQTHGLVLGEKYRLVYDSIDPNNLCRLLYNEPLFLKEERTNFTIGKIVYLKKREVVIGYDYEVSQVKHHHSQDLKKTAKEYQSLAKGTLYVVEYWEDNPQRSIIYVDQPIIRFDTLVVTITQPYKVKDNKEGLYTEYSYTYSGDTFTGTVLYNMTIHKGDKFQMLFYGSKDKQILGDILYNEPVFLKNEVTKITTGEVMSSQEKDMRIRYRYFVDSIMFEREQVLKGYVRDYKNIKEHKIFKVEYLIDNPQRAIIYLDQPVR